MLDKIASAGFDIHIFEAEDLIQSLDDSCDLPTGKTMDDFDDLLIDKYMEADDMLLSDLDLMGIESPLLVEITDGKWIFTDGHHRLAWAAVRGAPVPVIFLDFDTDLDDLWNLIVEGEIDYNHS